MRTSRLARLSVLFISLVLVASACGSGDDTVAGDDGADGQPDPAVGGAADPAGGGAADGGAAGPSGLSPVGDWVLVAATVDGAEVPLAQPPAELTIGAGEIRGSTGCNSFGGGIDLGGDGSMATREVAITEIGCDQPLMAFESAYVDALFRATAWAVEPSGLVLSGDGVELRYEPLAPPAPASLEGTVWLFDTVFDGTGVERSATSSRADKAPARLTISGTTAELVADDCGPLTFTVEGDLGQAGGGSISFGPDDADPVCDDLETNAATAHTGLVAATGFIIDGSRLTFIGLPGETVGFVAEG